MEHLNLRDRDMWALIEGEWQLVRVITRIRRPHEGKPSVWRVVHGKQRCSVTTDQLRPLLPEAGMIP